MKSCILTRLRTFVHDEDGITAIEYGLIAAVMAALIGVVFALLKVPMEALFTKIGLSLTAA